jgi:hypothetical protein
MDDPHDGIVTHEGRERRVLVGRTGDGRGKKKGTESQWVDGEGDPRVETDPFVTDRVLKRRRIVAI